MQTIISADLVNNLADANVWVALGEPKEWSSFSYTHSSKSLAQLNEY
jgi:hypothetical protein